MSGLSAVNELMEAYYRWQVREREKMEREMARSIWNLGRSSMTTRKPKRSATLNRANKKRRTST